jgi:hypothetical protein
MGTSIDVERPGNKGHWQEGCKDSECNNRKELELSIKDIKRPIMNDRKVGWDENRTRATPITFASERVVRRN